MSRIYLFLFLLAALAASGVVASSGSPGDLTVVRVLDASGAPVADVVVLVTRGDQYESSVLLTDRDGSAIFSAAQPRPCVITAIDPRGMFFDSE